MHHHGYLWVGDKAVFDDDGLRRMPVAPWAADDPEETVQRQAAYRAWTETFTRSEVPPLETAHWLLKSPALIRGTWDDPAEAVGWLDGVLREYGPRFAAEHDRDPERLARQVARAAQTLAHGGDISLGYYLARPTFLSVAVVTCSPNRADPALPCPTPHPPGPPPPPRSDRTPQP
ncbi:hypothetical protein [Streptomyces sp. RPT161]|uniref:hypothetical protein n=1 Tax=Streptomyces sp. RPT161 TaxID=3015993 RepID=UPI0022B8BEA7|nr:hypothetical protein [Streptomyces sp. RPT161]